jgi:hypothetical protein
MKNFYFMLALITTFIGYQHIDACTGAMDYSTIGVVLNNSECMQFSNLYKLGVENINYFRSCPQIKPAPGTKDIIVVTLPDDSVEFTKPINAPVTIATVDIISNIVTLVVKYSGGCATHQFNLYARYRSDSLSKICDFYLVHNTGNDSCDAAINETISFNLTPLLEKFPTELPKTFRFYQVCSPSCSYQNFIDYPWSPQDDCSVTYKRQTDASFMITLEKSRTTDNRTGAPRILITHNPSILTESPIDFAPVIDAELDWLQNMNIVTGIDSTDRQAIKKTFYGNNQYYTLQDTSLPFAMWFTGAKDSNDRWISTGVKDLCGINFQFNLPPSPVDITAINKTNSDHIFQNRKITASICANNLLRIISERNLSGSTLKIVTINGKALFSGTINNQNSVVVPKEVIKYNGWKAVSISYDNNVVLCPMISGD